MQFSRVQVDILALWFAALAREISTWTLENKIRIHLGAYNILSLLYG